MRQKIGVIRPMNWELKIPMIVEDLDANDVRDRYREVSPFALDEMVGWLKDCEILEEDYVIDLATQSQRVIHLVARFFEGGIQAFLAGL